MAHAINEVGNRYGRLRVMERAANLYGKAAWLCQCDCGNTIVVAGVVLRIGDANSCKCLLHEGANHRTHGMSKTPEYRSWRSMKMRCLNPKARGYRFWGGRGITICDRWVSSFENFLVDMGPRPKGKTLDRFPDRDGNYEPGNCRWATSSEQAKNSHHPLCRPSVQKLTDQQVIEIRDLFNHNPRPSKRRPCNTVWC
jgi:hypothetical protein